MRIFQLLEEKIVRYLFDKYAIYTSTKKFLFFLSGKSSTSLEWTSEHRSRHAEMFNYMCKCTSFNDQLSIHRDRSRSKKQSRRNSSTMLPTMSRLEPGKRDIILLNLDVKVFSYFFPPHSSLAHVTNFM